MKRTHDFLSFHGKKRGKFVVQFIDWSIWLIVFSFLRTKTTRGLSAEFSSRFSLSANDLVSIAYESCHCHYVSIRNLITMKHNVFGLRIMEWCWWWSLIPPLSDNQASITEPWHDHNQRDMMMNLWPELIHELPRNWSWLGFFPWPWYCWLIVGQIPRIKCPVTLHHHDHSDDHNQIGLWCGIRVSCCWRLAQFQVIRRVTLPRSRNQALVTLAPDIHLSIYLSLSYCYLNVEEYQRSWAKQQVGWSDDADNESNRQLLSCDWCMSKCRHGDRLEDRKEGDSYLDFVPTRTST